MNTADPTAPHHCNFILLTVAKSGSGLLQAYLNQHESVRCFGEIFKKGFIKKDSWQHLSGGSAEMRHLHQTDLLSFWKVILEKYTSDKPVLGATIFYSHREREEIWHYFASSRTRIIHLVREELIDSYLSLKLAEASGTKKRDGAEADAQRDRNIFIDLDDFQEYCKRFRRYFDSIKLLFSDNPCLEVSYSALVNDREKIMSEIYSFLGLPNQETSPRLTKELSRPREELITNWSEIATFIKSNEDLCVIHTPPVEKQQIFKEQTAHSPARATRPLPATNKHSKARPLSAAPKQTEKENRSFILLSAPRSGSNLLCDCLNQHESIRCFGEIFKKRAITKKRWQRLSGGSVDLSAELRHLHQTDLVSFWKMILKKYRLDKPVKGAKIFYSHRKGDEIWQYFASSRTSIIHLVREELIDSYLSLKLARASWLWKQGQGGKTDAQYNRNIFIDLDHFQKYCQRVRQYFDSIKLLFSNNPYLKVTYSDLVSDREKNMSQIYSFLGLPNQQTASRLSKQLSRPREELITNWSEVAPFIKSNEDLCVIH